jgi:hypothetical protein
VEVLGVLQLNVYAKRFKEHFTGFSVSTRSIDHGLFKADDLIALGANSGFFISSVSHTPDRLAHVELS